MNESLILHLINDDETQLNLNYELLEKISWVSFFLVIHNSNISFAKCINKISFIFASYFSDITVMFHSVSKWTTFLKQMELVRNPLGRGYTMELFDNSNETSTATTIRMVWTNCIVQKWGYHAPDYTSERQDQNLTRRQRGHDSGSENRQYSTASMYTVHSRFIKFKPSSAVKISFTSINCIYICIVVYRYC